MGCIMSAHLAKYHAIFLFFSLRTIPPLVQVPLYCYSLVTTINVYPVVQCDVIRDEHPVPRRPSCRARPEVSCNRGRYSLDEKNSVPQHLRKNKQEVSHNLPSLYVSCNVSTSLPATYRLAGAACKRTRARGVCVDGRQQHSCQPLPAGNSSSPAGNGHTY